MTVDLRPYLPRLTLEWLAREPLPPWQAVDGTLAFVDISGFTSMTERLAARGKVGAEEVSDILDASFGELLALSDAEGADLIKWGGDAVLLLFRGSQHAARATRATWAMVHTMGRIGRLRTSVGPVRLRMSVGIHSGAFHFFLVGDLHQELVLTGPAATITARMESIAEAGEVVVSPQTAALLPAGVIGERKAEGHLLRAAPHGPPSGPAPQPPIEGLDLATCLPLTIREHLLAGAIPSEAEHRPISACFIEFRGSDALLSEPDGEALAGAALARLMGTVQRSAETNGVSFFETDINQDGGKIMLIAGAPRTSGHDEEGMLRTARDVIEAGQDIPLALRLGVNAGRVFAGGFGPPFRRTYSVKGDAINLAARLMAKAPSGAIYATPAVLDRSRTAFQTTALEPFMVKGKVRPVEAWSVGPARGARAMTQERVELPLVGRTTELAALEEALAAARAGQGRIVELIGEPGIGKSRLVDELHRRAPDLPVLLATSDAYSQNAPYGTFHGLLRSIVGADPEADPQTVGARLAGCVASATPELTPWLPLLAIPLDATVAPTAETDALGEAFRKPRLEAAISTLLAALAPGPLLAVFDDAQWMDEASASLLARLALDLRERRWLILALRTGAGSGFEAAEAAAPLRLRLAPLAPEAAASALTAATEAAPLPAHVMDALTARAGGNPLFLQELLAAAQGATGEAELPASVEEVLAAQLDQLAPQDRLVLRYAAVLGTRFESGLLESILARGEARADRGTWSRLSAYVIREPFGWLHFRHALIRDTAYERLSFRRRQELHGQVGEAILADSRAPDEQAELLSLHFFHAQRFDQAWRYGRLAGDRARSAYANVEAARSYQRALEAARRVRGIPPPEVAAAYEAMGDARVRLGEFGAAADAFRAGRVLVRGDALAEARLLLKVSQMSWQQGRRPEALRWIRRADGLLEARRDLPARAERARLAVEYGAVRQQQGRASEAIRWWRRAIPEAEAAGARDALAHAYYLLDWALQSLGRGEEAVNAPAALVIYEELGDLGQQAKVLNNLGAKAYFEGAWDEAIAYYERARIAFERLGAQVDAATPILNIGEILSDQGQLPEAEAQLRQALRVCRAADYRSGAAQASALLGVVEARAGRFEEGLVLLADARALYLADGEKVAAIEVDAKVVECLVLRGDGRAASTLAADTLERALAADAGYLEPALRRLSGQALALIGRSDMARQALDEALATARRAGDEYQTALILEALRRLPAPARAGLDARAMADEHHRILAKLGVRATGPAPL